MLNGLSWTAEVITLRSRAKRDRRSLSQFPPTMPDGGGHDAVLIRTLSPAHPAGVGGHSRRVFIW
jgi:hypothetical protein